MPPLQQGLGLIEVLVALFIQSLGLVLFSALYIKTQHATQDAYYMTLATTAAHSLSERLMVNRDTELQPGEVALWQAEIAQLLPNARGYYHCSSVTCTAMVEWQDRQPQQKAFEFPDYKKIR